MLNTNQTKNEPNQQENKNANTKHNYCKGVVPFDSLVEGVVLQVQARQAPEGLQGVQCFESRDQVAAHLVQAGGGGGWTEKTSIHRHSSRNKQKLALVDVCNGRQPNLNPTNSNQNCVGVVGDWCVRVPKWLKLNVYGNLQVNFTHGYFLEHFGRGAGGGHGTWRFGHPGLERSSLVFLAPRSIRYSILSACARGSLLSARIEHPQATTANGGGTKQCSVAFKTAHTLPSREPSNVP